MTPVRRLCWESPGDVRRVGCPSADIIVAPLIDRMSDLGMSNIWQESYPRVSDWYARMQARPAFQQTFYRGSRMSEFLNLSPAIKEHA